MLMSIVSICRTALFFVTAILFTANGVYGLYFGRKAFNEVNRCCSRRRYLSPDDLLSHAVKMMIASFIILMAFALLALRLIEVNQAQGDVMLNYCLSIVGFLTFDLMFDCVFIIPFAFGKIDQVKKALPAFTKIIWAGKAGWCIVAAIEFGMMAVHYLAAL